MPLTDTDKTQDASLAKSCSHLVEQLSNLAKENEINLRTLGPEDAVERFKAVESSRLAMIHRNLEDYVQILSEANDSGIDFRKNDRGLVWIALKRFRLKGFTNLLEHIQEQGEIIEIYNEEQYQIFRNLSFLELSGHCVEDILVRPWTDLFEREPQFVDAILEQCRATMAGKINSYKFEGIEDNWVRERRPDDQGAMLCRLNLKVPLYSSSAGPGEAPVALLSSLQPLKFVQTWPVGASKKPSHREAPSIQAE